MGTTCVSLIRRVGEGTQSTTWSEFLSVYLPFIDQHLRRLGLAEFDALDIRQNVLVVMLCELPKFQHNGNAGAFRLWLRTVITNQLQTHFRRRRRLPTPIEFSSDELACEGSEFARWWEREYAEYVFKQAMNRLAARFDSVTLESFERQFLRHESPGEVATALGKTKQGVIAAKCRVLRALRHELMNLQADI